MILVGTETGGNERSNFLSSPSHQFIYDRVYKKSAISPIWREREKEREQVELHSILLCTKNKTFRVLFLA